MLSQLKEEIEGTLTAKALTETFEEVAAARMQAIRASVAQTRTFLQEVDQVFGQVKQAYWAWGVKHSYKTKEGKISQASARVKNGRIAWILLSANSGLYGDLPLKVVKSFIANYRSKLATTPDLDVFVVGKVGQYLVSTEQPKIPFTGFDLADDKPEESQMNALLNMVVNHSQIFITYAHFESLLAQVPETADISGGDVGSDKSALEQQLAGQVSDTKINNIMYEPSVVAVAQFFESEILKALLRQKIYEMQLARFASRMVAMDQATDKTNDQLVTLQSEALRQTKQLANRKLQELFAGASIWE